MDTMRAAGLEPDMAAYDHAVATFTARGGIKAAKGFRAGSATSALSSPPMTQMAAPGADIGDGFGYVAWSDASGLPPMVNPSDPFFF